MEDGMYGAAKAVARTGASAIHKLASLASYPSRLMYGGLNAAQGMPGGYGNTSILDGEGGIEASQYLANNGYGFFKNDPNKWEWRDPASGVVDIFGDPTTYIPAVAPLRLLGKGLSAASKATGLTKKIASSEIGLLARAAFDSSVKGTYSKHVQPHVSKYTSNLAARDNDTTERILRISKEQKDRGISERDLRLSYEGLGPATRYNAETSAMLEASRSKDEILGTGSGGARLVDPYAGYHPRYLSGGVAKEENRAFRTTSTLSARTAEDAGREEMFKGFRLGTVGVDDLLQDADLHRTIDSGGNLQDAIALKYGGIIDRDIPVGGSFPPRDRYKLLSDYMRMNPKTREGIYKNAVHADLLRHELNKNKQHAGAELMMAAIPDAAKPMVSGGSGIRIDEFLNERGYKRETLEGVAAKMGMTPDEAGQQVITDHVAKELSRFTPDFVAPQYASRIGEKLKGNMRWMKALTLAFPQSRGRDFGGGVAQNLLMNQFSLGSYADADKLMRGGLVSGDYRKNKFVSDWLQKTGKSPTQKNQTEALRQAVAVHLREDSGVMKDLAAGQRGHELDDILHSLPGQSKRGLTDYWAAEPVKTWFGAGPGKESSPFSRKDLWSGIQGTIRKDGTQVEKTTYGPVKASEIVSERTDRLNRIAPLLKRMRKGEDLSQAASLVGKSQVDYGDLTGVEKIARDYAIPFYAFNSRMMRHTLPQALDPTSRTSKLIRAQDKVAGSDPSTPPYIESGMSIPVGELPDGTKNYITGFGLMHEPAVGAIGNAIGVGSSMAGSLGNYSASAYRSLTGNKQAAAENYGLAHQNIMNASDNAANLGYAALASTNPLLNAPLQHLTGQTFFQRGEPIAGLDSTTGRLIRNASQLTGLEKQDESKYVEPFDYPYRGMVDASLNAIMPASRLAQTAKTLSDTRGGVLSQESLGKKALNLLTGVRVTGISARKQLSALRDKLEDKLKQIEGVREKENLYIPKERRERMMRENPEEYKQFLLIQEQIKNVSKQLKQ